MARSQRVTTVPHTSIRSHATLSDLFPLPKSLFILLLTIRALTRHWVVTLTVVLALIAYAHPHAHVSLALLLPVALVTLCYIALYLTNRHHSPAAVLRGLRRVSRARRRWGRAARAGRLIDGPTPPSLFTFLPGPAAWQTWRPPRLLSPDGNHIEFTLDLSRIDKTSVDLENAVPNIVSTFGAKRARVQPITVGRARLIVEWGSFKPALAPNTSQLPIINLDTQTDVWLQLDNHLLVVGKSGAGKSNLTWHLINGLNANQVNYKLHLIDPKKVELADLVHSPHTVTYADTPSQIEPTIANFYDQMTRRLDYLKLNNMRKVDLLDPNTPLNILVIDELLLIPQSLRQGTDAALSQILTAGRSAGYIVVASSQLGQVDAIERIRDLFPQRVCMAVQTSHMTNATLGPRAEERGARCTEITLAGEGYIYSDDTAQFQRFRPPFIMDTRAIAAGKQSNTATTDPSLPTQSPITHPVNRRTYVYRLYHHNGTLLYVGISHNPAKRMQQHQTTQPWFHQVDHSRTTYVPFPNKSAALASEEQAIKEEAPRYNHVHREAS